MLLWTDFLSRSSPQWGGERRCCPRAGLDAFKAAAAATGEWNFAATYQQLATDQPGGESWPVTGASFILVPKTPQNGATSSSVLRFFDWALHHGESQARSLDYALVAPGVVYRLLSRD